MASLKHSFIFLSHHRKPLAEKNSTTDYRQFHFRFRQEIDKVSSSGKWKLLTNFFFLRFFDKSQQIITQPQRILRNQLLTSALDVKL